MGVSCLAESLWPALRASLTNCLTLRHDNQPKADVSEGHEVEVSEEDTQHGDPAFSLLSSSAQHTHGGPVSGAHCGRCTAGRNDEEHNKAGFFLFFNL